MWCPSFLQDITYLGPKGEIVKMIPAHLRKDFTENIRTNIREKYRETKRQANGELYYRTRPNSLKGNVCKLKTHMSQSRCRDGIPKNRTQSPKTSPVLSPWYTHDTKNKTTIIFNK